MKHLPEPVKGDGLNDPIRNDKNTSRMVVFKILRNGTPFGSKGDYVRSFLSDDAYVLLKIEEAWGYFRIIQDAAVKRGRIDFKRGRRKRHKRRIKQHEFETKTS